MTLMPLTSAGLSRPTTDEILTDLLDKIEARFSPIYGEPLRRDPESVIGMLAAIFAGAVDDQCAGIQMAYDAGDSRTATDAALDGLCADTDTDRKAATSSTGTYYATGDAASPLFAGDLVSNPGGDLGYQLTSGPVLAAATARATTTTVAAGQVRSNSGHCYVAVVGGTTGSGPGPSGTVVGVAEVDGTVTWAFVGDGLAFAAVPIKSTTAGPVGGPAYSLSRIGTPRTGWKGGCNIADVQIGSDLEPDEVLRVRRESELHGEARSAVDAIRAAFTSRVDVSECIVFENPEDATDANGIGPHGIEAVVDGAITDDDAATVLLRFMTGGIKTYGTTTVTKADGWGNTHTIRFSRPAFVDVYVQITVAVDGSAWPSQPDATEAPLTVGQVAARDAVLAYGQTLILGTNVRHTRLGAVVISSGIAGVLGADAQIDTVPITTQPPADLAISLRQRARFDSTRTTIVQSFEDP